jgi:starvation-inducible DNA-binding protein
MDLALILKHIHWNVVGSGFIAVHQLMDQQTDQTRAMIDAIAERISTLGGVPLGLAGDVVEHRSAERDYALGRAEVLDHLRSLDEVYENVGEGQRVAIEQVSKLDPVTEDLLISQASELELNHWFIRAHITEQDGSLSRT